MAYDRNNVFARILRGEIPCRKVYEDPYVFAFHAEGLFAFYCTMHQPEMSGQILVLPSESG